MSTSVGRELFCKLIGLRWVTTCADCLTATLSSNQRHHFFLRTLRSSRDVSPRNTHLCHICPQFLPTREGYLAFLAESKAVYDVLETTVSLSSHPECESASCEREAVKVASCSASPFALCPFHTSRKDVLSVMAQGLTSESHVSIILSVFNGNLIVAQQGMTQSLSALYCTLDVDAITTQTSACTPQDLSKT